MALMEPLAGFMAAAEVQVIVALHPMEPVVLVQYVLFGPDQPVCSHQLALVILN